MKAKNDMKTVFVKHGDRKSEITLHAMDEVQEGELFGVIVSSGDMRTITPSITVKPGDIGVEYGLILEKDEDFYYNYDDVPLIMKKLSGNYAQDILTGNIFAVGVYSEIGDEFRSINGDIEKFQQISEEYENKVIIISSDLSSKVYYAIDDSFKHIYGLHTLSRKGDIVLGINNFVSLTNDKYKENFEMGIEKLRNVAETENLIIDFEKGNSKIKK